MNKMKAPRKSKWKCPKCKREFGKKNQTHSCTVFPLEKHFRGKEEVARPLYDKLKAEMEKKIGPVKIESLPCCIHFVSNYTFGCAYALKDRIRIHFSLSYKLKSKRIDKSAQTSKIRHMYSMDIKEASEIDSELLGWLKEAYNLKQGK